MPANHDAEENHQRKRNKNNKTAFFNIPEGLLFVGWHWRNKDSPKNAAKTSTYLMCSYLTCRTRCFQWGKTTVVPCYTTLFSCFFTCHSIWGNGLPLHFLASSLLIPSGTMDWGPNWLFCPCINYSQSENFWVKAWVEEEMWWCKEVGCPTNDLRWAINVL